MQRPEPLLAALFLAIAFVILLAAVPCSKGGSTTGPQSVFVALLQYPDRHCSFTHDSAVSSVNTMCAFFGVSSYGSTSLTQTVTRTFMMMPHSGTYYDGFDARSRISADARSVAQANGYGDIINNYDHVVYMFPYTDGVGSNGWSAGKEVWMRDNIDTRLLTHEMGHQYGLYHAHRWVPCDLSNPLDSCGTTLALGDCYDIMGSGPEDFNPFEKNRLNWIPPNTVQHVTATGVYRISRFDAPNANSFDCIAVTLNRPSDGRPYWIFYRYTPSTARLGAIVEWVDEWSSTLVDFHPATITLSDVVIPVGATLTDQGVTTTPIGIGGVSPNFWIDVQIEFN